MLVTIRTSGVKDKKIRNHLFLPGIRQMIFTTLIGKLNQVVCKFKICELFLHVGKLTGVQYKFLHCITVVNGDTWCL